MPNTQDTDYEYGFFTEENGPLGSYKLGEKATRTAQVMNLVYGNAQGFAVYDVMEGERRYKVAGSFPYSLLLNRFYRFTGTVALDKTGLRQIKVTEFENALPTDPNGIVTVLRTLYGLNTQASMLYDAIGPDVLNIIMETPEVIVEKTKGISLKRVKRWQEELLAMGSNDAQLKKLYALGLNQNQATALVSKHGFSICDEVARNPYFLMGEVSGFGFKKCDKMALDAGLAVDHPERLRAGLKNIISSIEERGHCTYPYDAFFEAAHNLLDLTINYRTAQQILREPTRTGTVGVAFGKITCQVNQAELRAKMNAWSKQSRSSAEKFNFATKRIDDAALEQALKELESGGYIFRETVRGKQFVTPGYLYRAENAIASDIRDIVLNERFPFESREAVIQQVLTEDGVTLEEKQLEAVRKICAAEGGGFILNGSAGCGKTFTLRIIVKVLRRLYKEEKRGEFNPCILAPTGKAAKVASVSTSLPAQTIHRALGLISSDTVSQTGLNNNTLINNCVIVDEFSMVDELLCSQLLSGIPKTAKVIFLGDTEQLPSIRAGRVLKDLIESDAIPVITLNVVKRQAENSGVLINAKRIIAGELIKNEVLKDRQLDGNAYIRFVNSVFAAQKQVLQFSKNCGLQSFQNGYAQVLTPVKAGAIGVDELNYHLQQILNPAQEGKELVTGKMVIHKEDESEDVVQTSFRIGDCVMHTKNNYNAPWLEWHPINGFIQTSKNGIVNGETGIVSAINCFKDGSGQRHNIVYVRYGNYYIAYDNDFDELSLSYAMTIHKSQGSQWPLVICPLAQGSQVLNRKLLYTMYTRASSTNTLIAREDLIYSTIANNREDARLTLLKERIRKEI